MRHSDRKISVFACDLLTTVDRSSLVAYSQTMIEVIQTELFADWFEGLRDRQAKARIQARIDRMELGNFGDVASVGEGVSELRIHYGPGYRVYFVQRGEVIVILLSGGDKSTQDSDIQTAKKIAKKLED
jgi:putative addiction module killer protein